MSWFDNKIINGAKVQLGLITWFNFGNNLISIGYKTNSTFLTFFVKYNTKGLETLLKRIESNSPSGISAGLQKEYYLNLKVGIKQKEFVDRLFGELSVIEDSYNSITKGLRTDNPEFIKAQRNFNFIASLNREQYSLSSLFSALNQKLSYELAIKKMRESNPVNSMDQKGIKAFLERIEGVNKFCTTSLKELFINSNIQVEVDAQALKANGDLNALSENSKETDFLKLGV